MAKKIILFGGSFDPFHNGHFDVARYSAKVIGADEVVFIPAKRSPHKKVFPAAGNDARFEMISGLKESKNNADFLTKVYLPWLLKFGQTFGEAVKMKPGATQKNLFLKTPPSKINGIKVVGIKGRIPVSAIMRTPRSLSFKAHPRAALHSMPPRNPSAMVAARREMCDSARAKRINVPVV